MHLKLSFLSPVHDLSPAATAVAPSGPILLFLPEAGEWVVKIYTVVCAQLLDAAAAVQSKLQKTLLLNPLTC